MSGCPILPVVVAVAIQVETLQRSVEVAIVDDRGVVVRDAGGHSDVVLNIVCPIDGLLGVLEVLVVLIGGQVIFA